MRSHDDPHPEAAMAADELEEHERKALADYRAANEAVLKPWRAREEAWERFVACRVRRLGLNGTLAELRWVYALNYEARLGRLDDRQLLPEYTRIEAEVPEHVDFYLRELFHVPDPEEPGEAAEPCELYDVRPAEGVTFNYAERHGRKAALSFETWARCLEFVREAGLRVDWLALFRAQEQATLLRDHLAARAVDAAALTIDRINPEASDAQ